MDRCWISYTSRKISHDQMLYWILYTRREISHVMCSPGCYGFGCVLHPQPPQGGLDFPIGNPRSLLQEQSPLATADVKESK